MQKHMQYFAIQYFATLKSAKYISFGSSGEGWLRELGGEVQRCLPHTFKLSSEASPDGLGHRVRGGTLLLGGREACVPHSLLSLKTTINYYRGSSL